MENKKKNWCYMGIAALVIALLLALDQWTKHLAVVCLKGQPGYVLIDGLCLDRVLENTENAAFSADFLVACGVNGWRNRKFYRSDHTEICGGFHIICIDSFPGI